MSPDLTGTLLGLLHTKSVSVNPDQATLLLPKLGEGGNLAELAEPHA